MQLAQTPGVDAKKLAAEAYTVMPDRREALALLINYAIIDGEHDRAMELSEAMMALGKPSKTYWSLNHEWYGWKGDELYRQCLRLNGKVNSADNDWLASVNDDNNTITVIHNTSGHPEKSLAVRETWLSFAAHPSNVDYIFNIDKDDTYRYIVKNELGEQVESDSAIMRLANRIIMDAYTRGASDIHIEPYGKTRPTRIRLRVDGICGVYKEIPASHRKALVSRYKIMSNLDISERRKPQDGKIKIKTAKGLIELRVATLPSAGGEEDVVMRILAASKPMKLEDMGFSERNLSVFKELVAKPYGVVLCVGPTGSGKTTTLHSALGHINTPERKIWTAEDPVEITQFGLRQVPVKAKIGVTFSTLLRAFLRADPDVIMIGEMRDEETAQIGIEASLTGHLVFSTLHTNSAPETVTRLIDLGVDPYSFADALLCVLAQRLARRLCKHCKKAYHPVEDEFRGIAAEYGEEHFDRLGFSYTKDLELFEAVGCKECNGAGYKGRLGIHELLAGTDEVKRVIQRKAPIEEIRDRAIEDGMTTLMQDGIRKVFLGITDMKQIRGVCIR